MNDRSVVSASTPPVTSSAKWRERLGWLAPVALAAIVVCSGCFMLFAFALTARGELEAAVLGSDWRVWQLQAKGTHGIGVSQTRAYTSDSGRACRATTNWLITWRPLAHIEMIDDISCEESAEGRQVARRLHSAIIADVGGRL